MTTEPAMFKGLPPGPILPPLPFPPEAAASEEEWQGFHEHGAAHRRAVAEDAARELAELAAREYRGPREQAAWLIIDGLRRAGLGPHDAAAASPEKTRKSAGANVTPPALTSEVRSGTPTTS